MTQKTSAHAATEFDDFHNGWTLSIAQIAAVLSDGPNGLDIPGS
jgi:hypothetical protein